MLTRGRNTISSNTRASSFALSLTSSESGSRGERLSHPPSLYDVLYTEAFRGKLLAALHQEFADILKTEVRAILESELAVIGSYIKVVRAKLRLLKQ